MLFPDLIVYCVLFDAPAGADFRVIFVLIIYNLLLCRNELNFKLTIIIYYIKLLLY